MPIREVLRKYGVLLLLVVVFTVVIAAVLFRLAPAGWIPGANIFQFIHSGLVAFANALGLGSANCGDFVDATSCAAQADCIWDPRISKCIRSPV